MSKQYSINFFSAIIATVFLSLIFVNSVETVSSCCLFYKGNVAQDKCSIYIKEGFVSKTDLDELGQKDFPCKSYDSTKGIVINSKYPEGYKISPGNYVAPLNFAGSYTTDGDSCAVVSGYSSKFMGLDASPLCMWKFQYQPFDKLLQDSIDKQKKIEEAQNLKEQQLAEQALKEVELTVKKTCCLPKYHKDLMELSDNGNNYSNALFIPINKKSLNVPFGMTVNSPDVCKTSADDNTNEIVAMLTQFTTCDQLPNGKITQASFWLAAQSCTELATLAPWLIDTTLLAGEKAGKDQELYNLCILGPKKYKAQIGTEGTGLDIPETSGLNKLGSTDVNTIIGRVIKAIMGIMGSIALAMFVYSGILWMTAAGNSEKEEKSKTILVWSTLGVIVVFASYALLNFVFEILK